MTSAPGAAIRLAASRYEAGTPIEIYTAITPPAMHAMLPVIEASSSDFVIPDRYGRIHDLRLNLSDKCTGNIGKSFTSADSHRQ